jgi:glycosyltransferase involved in cell wall biosynthesis
MTAATQPREINVFVHLGHGFGANSWSHRYALGLIPGLNDRLAYGYHHAAGDGWSVEYSQDAEENSVFRFCRIGLRRLLGFDLIHAWRNRKRLLAADLIWTHTELESLAVLFLFRASGRRSPPKLIANCVWLFDRWPSFSRPRRFIYRELLKRADAVTTLSPDNLKVARRVLPLARSECVLWGAAIQDLKQPKRSKTHQPLRIASLGSDMHRDWQTLITAFSNIDRYEVKIASTKIKPKLVAGSNNVKVISAVAADDVKKLYEWADIIVVPLTPNLHASGITVVLESIILAVPLVCTDTGGLRAYFSSAEVCYVPPSAPLAMRAAVEELARDHTARLDMVIKAQKQLLAANLTSKGFAERHRHLSEQLLLQDPKYAVIYRAARTVA